MSSHLCLRFIRYCELEQGYTGFDYKDADGEEDVVTRLASLKITSDGMFPYTSPKVLWNIMGWFPGQG